MAPEQTRELTVSIIVPTYNRRDRLERMLRSLVRAYEAGDRFEVIVCVDGATDGTEAMLAALRVPYPLRVLMQMNSGAGAARNRAIAAAGGDVLLFLDDDVEPVPGMIGEHLSIHRRDDHAVVTGPMVAPPGMRMAPWLLWEAVALQKQYDAMLAGEWASTPRQFYTANASVRRAHALDAGGFDETFKRAEDVEFAYRLADRGARFHFVAAAAVLHEPDRTLPGWLNVAYQYGRYDVIMERGRGRAHVRYVYHESRQRHRLNRLLPRLTAGRPLRHRMAVALLTIAVRAGRRILPHRLHMALCSALFAVQYWQGVAEESGLGRALWRQLERHEAIVPRLTVTVPDAVP